MSTPNKVQLKFDIAKIIEKDEIPSSNDLSLGGSSAIKGNVPKNTCNCKKSKCLKLYCDCFAYG
jgi:hypothetical protein